MHDLSFIGMVNMVSYSSWEEGHAVVAAMDLGNETAKAIPLNDDIISSKGITGKKEVF